jgi:hypothetical protein
MFMSLLDRHPQLVGLMKDPSAPAMSSTGQHVPSTSPLETLHSSTDSPGGRSASYFPKLPDLTTTPSKLYEAEFVRSLSCTSPVDSPGLSPLAYRHTLEGLWQGKYLYLDHPAYQSALAGNIRSIYDGAFGEQKQEMFLQEIVINVHKDHLGGTGSPLLGGFQPSEIIQDGWRRQEGTPDEKGWEFCQDEAAPDRPGWTKELMIAGHGRSGWGEFSVNGRVRSWDGLVNLVFHYTDLHAAGKWHFRAYVRAGDMLCGRWRETFTKENMRGESCVCFSLADFVA